MNISNDAGGIDSSKLIEYFTKDFFYIIFVFIAILSSVFNLYFIFGSIIQNNFIFKFT